MRKLTIENIKKQINKVYPLAEFGDSEKWLFLCPAFEFSKEIDTLRSYVSIRLHIRNNEKHSSYLYALTRDNNVVLAQEDGYVFPRLLKVAKATDYGVPLLSGVVDIANIERMELFWTLVSEGEEFCAYQSIDVIIRRIDSFGGNTIAVINDVFKPISKMTDAKCHHTVCEVQEGKIFTNVKEYFNTTAEASFIEGALLMGENNNPNKFLKIECLETIGVYPHLSKEK